jgi:hypothetical protein
LVLAVLAAALCGSLVLSAFAAAESALAPDALLDPAGAFIAVFVFSLLFSIPVVAIAMILFARLAGAIVGPGTRLRGPIVVALGAAGGVLIGFPVSMLLNLEGWAPLLVGLAWGVPSAVAGLLLLSTPHAGEANG